MALQWLRWRSPYSGGGSVGVCVVSGGGCWCGGVAVVAVVVLGAVVAFACAVFGGGSVGVCVFGGGGVGDCLIALPVAMIRG